MKIIVKLQNGQVAETITELTKVVIGRSAKSDFSVKDESLSRHHCLVEFDKGEFFITDLASSNGVFIEGTKLEPNKRTPFSTYFQLSLGSLECIIEDIEMEHKTVTRSVPAASLGQFELEEIPKLEVVTVEPGEQPVEVDAILASVKKGKPDPEQAIPTRTKN